MALFSWEERMKRIAQEIQDLDDCEVENWTDHDIEVYGRKNARKLNGDLRFMCGEVLDFTAQHSPSDLHERWTGNGLEISFPRKNDIGHVTEDGRRIPWCHVHVQQTG